MWITNAKAASNNQFLWQIDVITVAYEEATDVFQIPKYFIYY